jgi:hypothetical protein
MNQGLIHAGQMLYLLIHAPSPTAMNFWSQESLGFDSSLLLVKCLHSGIALTEMASIHISYWKRPLLPVWL